MNKPFRIYHNAGQIATITTEELDGDYVIVTDDEAKHISDNISSYTVEDGKIVNIKKIKKARPSLQFSNKFDLGQHKQCWITEKNNLFACVSGESTQPKTFDQTKYSWVKYVS